MTLRCILSGHRAAAREARNQGFDFSRCRQCRRDMIRSANRWRTVPRGFRVVWKPAPRSGTEISARQLLFDLPATGRSVIPMTERARSSPSDILILAMLGLRYLLWVAAERLRCWGRRALAGRVARQPVIYLPSCAPAPAVSQGS